MPRHRRERGHRRRALGREGGSWRSALFGRPEPGGRPGVSGASGQRFRLARSLLLTPWFAAGAGIVIAAAVAVDSPAVLTYSPSGPGVHCSVSHCVGPSPDHEPDVATATPGVVLKAPGSHQHGAAEAGSVPTRAAQAGAGAGYLVGYQVIRRRRHGFVAIISMPGDLKPGFWSLEFAFPSARVDRVWGALWRASGNGQGGTALGPVQWTGQPPRAPDAGQLVVLASGTPTAPSSCTLDGVSCSFG
jgi:hypothetical protein